MNVIENIIVAFFAGYGFAVVIFEISAPKWAKVILFIAFVIFATMVLES